MDSKRPRRDVQGNRTPNKRRNPWEKTLLEEIVTDPLMLSLAFLSWMAIIGMIVSAKWVFEKVSWIFDKI